MRKDFYFVQPKFSLLETKRIARPLYTKVSSEADWWKIDFSELWQCNQLLYFLVWRDIKVRYKQTVIGIGWAFLQPLLTALLLSVVFRRFTSVSGTGLPPLIFYYSGMVPWTYFSSAIQSSTNIMIENQRLLTKIYFPRVFLPLAACLSVVVDFFIAMAILVIMMLAWGIFPSWKIATLPFAMLIMVITAIGLGSFFSGLNALYRDIRYATPFIIQFCMFASPVLYPSNIVPEKWQWAYRLNPVVGIIEFFRWSITPGGYFPKDFVFWSLGAGLTIFLLGFLCFKKIETVIPDVL